MWKPVVLEPLDWEASAPGVGSPAGIITSSDTPLQHDDVPWSMQRMLPPTGHAHGGAEDNAGITEALEQLLNKLDEEQPDGACCHYEEEPQWAARAGCPAGASDRCYGSPAALGEGSATDDAEGQRKAFAPSPTPGTTGAPLCNIITARGRSTIVTLQTSPCSSCCSLATAFPDLQPHSRGCGAPIGESTEPHGGTAGSVSAGSSGGLDADCGEEERRSTGPPLPQHQSSTAAVPQTTQFIAKTAAGQLPNVQRAQHGAKSVVPLITSPLVGSARRSWWERGLGAAAASERHQASKEPAFCDDPNNLPAGMLPEVRGSQSSPLWHRIGCCMMPSRSLLLRFEFLFEDATGVSGEGRGGRGGRGGS